MESKKYIEVSLSQVGVNEDSGILQEWLVEEGQFISVGTIICEFETTKTLIEIEVENTANFQRNTKTCLLNYFSIQFYLCSCSVKIISLA